MGGGASRRRRQGGKADGLAGVASLSDTLKRRRRVLLGSDGPEPQAFELLPPLQQFEKFPQAADPNAGLQTCSCGSVFRDDTQFCRACGAARTVASTFEKCSCGQPFQGDSTFCRSCGQKRPVRPAMPSDCVFERIGMDTANEFRRNSNKVCNADGYLGPHAIELLGLDISANSALSNRLYKIGQVGRSMPALQPPPVDETAGPKPADEEHDPRAPRPAMLTCYELLALFSVIRAGSKDDLLELLFCLFDIDEDDRISLGDFEATIAGYLELEGATGLQGAELDEYNKFEPKQRTLAAKRVAELAIAKYSCGVELPPPDAEAPAVLGSGELTEDKVSPGAQLKDREASVAGAVKEEHVTLNFVGQLSPTGKLVHPLGLNIGDRGRITKVTKGQAKTQGAKAGWHVTLIDDQPFTNELFKQRQADGVQFRMTFRKEKPRARSGRGRCGCFGGSKPPAGEKQEAKDPKKESASEENSDSESSWAASSDDGHKQRQKQRDEQKKLKQKRRWSFSPRRKAKEEDKDKDKEKDSPQNATDSPLIKAAAETEGSRQQTDATGESEEVKAGKSAKSGKPPSTPRKGKRCGLCAGGMGKKSSPSKKSMQPLTFDQWKNWFVDNFGDFEIPESLGAPAPMKSMELSEQDISRALLPQDINRIATIPPVQTIPPKGAPLGRDTGIRSFEDDDSVGDVEVLKQTS